MGTRVDRRIDPSQPWLRCSFDAMVFSPSVALLNGSGLNGEEDGRDGTV